MAKRDPNKTARNKLDKEISERLNELWPTVAKDTGVQNLHSFNALIGGKAATFIDLKNEVISSHEEYLSHYLKGFARAIAEDGWTAGGASFGSETLKHNKKLFLKSAATKEYFTLFLKRSYLRHYEELVRNRPAIQDAEVWIGQNNSDYGLLITPRYKNGTWENDKSEIRHFKHLYWTIGHILATGLVVDGDPDPMPFANIDEYLNSFQKVLVRPSGSAYERQIAKLYAEYVKAQEKPEEVPLLIPELRYNGKDKKHKFRLDFCIINPITLNKVGIELSPWSTHGKLAGTKGKTQQQINDEAQANFEKEAEKHRSYFQKHAISTLIYTDKPLADIPTLFGEVEKYLTLKPETRQLEFQLMAEFL
ncbi:MAG: hypothetical protein KK478_06175 [Ensifer alkalisoli]|nr:hypothetical protein [Sinorhizobium alkalisoli]